MYSIIRSLYNSGRQFFYLHVLFLLNIPAVVVQLTGVLSFVRSFFTRLPIIIDDVVPESTSIFIGLILGLPSLVSILPDRIGAKCLV